VSAAVIEHPPRHLGPQDVEDFDYSSKLRRLSVLVIDLRSQLVPSGLTWLWQFSSVDSPFLSLYMNQRPFLPERSHERPVSQRSFAFFKRNKYNGFILYYTNNSFRKILDTNLSG
jgi:hypothetical protein